MSRTHRFRSTAQDLIVAKALMRHTLLQDQAVLAALTRYIASLCLQSRVASGQLSDRQALIIFEKAIHTFTRKLHTELNERFTTEKLDQTDLSNPLNMQAALNNPLSYANQLMSDTAAALESALIDESYQNELAFTQQNTQPTEDTLASTATSSEPHLQHIETVLAKTALLVGAITLFDEAGADIAKDKIESAFFKETGIKTEFHKESPEKETHSILEKVLKPEFKDFHNNKEQG